MGFYIGTVRCQCANVMGMPTDTGECEYAHCGEKKSFYGEKSYTRLQEWAEAHSQQHDEEIEPMIEEAIRRGKNAR